MQKSPPLNIASLVLVVFFFPVTLNLHARVQITSYWRAFWLVGLLNVECTRKFSKILRCYSTCSPLCYNVFAFLVQLPTGTFFFLCFRRVHKKNISLLPLKTYSGFIQWNINKCDLTTGLLAPRSCKILLSSKISKNMSEKKFIIEKED
jgi:hypothetical protein